MGDAGPDGGLGKWGTTHCPQPIPTPKAAPTEGPEGPRELKNSSRRKRPEQQVPPPRPPSTGLSKRKGGERGLDMPPLLRALTPGKEAAHPALALQKILGGPEGRSSFPPSAFLLLPRSLIPFCPHPYRQRQMVQWPSSSGKC